MGKSTVGDPVMYRFGLPGRKRIKQHNGLVNLKDLEKPHSGWQAAGVNGRESAPRMSVIMPMVSKYRLI